MSVRRMLPFILINIVVSATVVLLVLAWWDGRRPEPEAMASATAAAIETPTTMAQAAEQAAPDATAAPDGAETAAESESGDEGPTVHIVQAGETLGRISQQYDVPIEDIAEFNNIVNVNTLSVGQELIIPIGGIPTATAPAAAEPTDGASPTPLATEPPEEGTAIVEITEVIGVGELTTEAVRLTNVGTRQIGLLDWTLRDEDDDIFRFGAATLFGSSDAGSPSILVHTEAGQNGPSDLFWGRESAVWESGETVTLLDAEGTVQATYTIP